MFILPAGQKEVTEETLSLEYWSCSNSSSKMPVIPKHIAVPILAVSRAWEWKGFHLHIFLFLYALVKQ